VRGFNEQGTTTTPFSMVILNDMSRYQLAAAAIARVPRLASRAPALLEACDAETRRAIAYAREHFEDPADIAEWTWKS
jgi:xylulose-5-phosphate/fructose-6-phosphate phosphoketolase